jgi:hypothetical protein
MEPQIILPTNFEGIHNQSLDASKKRIEDSGYYKDQSVVVVSPAISAIPPKVVASWLNLMHPPNAARFHAWALGMEVGEAFSKTIKSIVDHPQLGKFRYILTLETDNTPPPDGVVKLLNRMDKNPRFAAISGLYWTKGVGGVPQIWGDPSESTFNCRPQPPRFEPAKTGEPQKGALVECQGLGMGFTLFKMSMFRDKRLTYPWFKTVASLEEGSETQDLYFWKMARQHGFRCAVDCDCLVGHYDFEGKFGLSDTFY